MPDRPPPLNGTKTHPLSPAALSALAKLRGGPVPSQEINPGVVNRLLREGTVEIVQLASPYATHKGRLLSHLQLRPR